MSARVSLVISLLSLAACAGPAPDRNGDDDDGGDDGGMTTQSVTTVECTGTPPAVTATGDDASGKYEPANTTISAGGTIKFTMPLIHNMIPDTTKTTDPGLKVNFNEEKCLKFAKKGTFNFICASHSFRGTVTVN